VNGPGAPPEAVDTGGRAALLINARSRLGARAEEAVEAALRREGLTLERVARVRRPERLRDAADDLSGLGVGRVIVGAGDGTLGPVAARLAARGVALGVIPLGTANDFARALAIPTDLGRAAAVAAGSHARRIDLAVANGVPFLNTASIGLSVATTRVPERLKRWLGPAAYALAGALAVLRHAPFEVRLESPGGSVEQRVLQVVAGNGRFFGGGDLVAGGSTLDDGMLVIYTLGARGRLRLLRTVALLRLQFPLDRPGDAFFSVTEALVTTRPARLPVSLDGEVRTETPVRFAVRPGALLVLTPPPADETGPEA
jgi:YegS/Rv2252/BmrU family lipid kinase